MRIEVIRKIAIIIKSYRLKLIYLGSRFMDIQKPIIIDNILDEYDADMIENTLTSENFPWGIQKNTVSFDDIVDGHRDMPYMTHIFTENGHVMSPYIHIPMCILQTLAEKTGRHYTDTIRIRANLTHPACGERLPTPIHTDNMRPHHVIIYYPIDSDGDTIIYTDASGKEILMSVAPKKNRILIFDGSYNHCAVPTKDHHMRMVINYNLSPIPAINI